MSMGCSLQARRTLSRVRVGNDTRTDTHYQPACQPIPTVDITDRDMYT